MGIEHFKIGMTQLKMIILDLEWNRGYENTPLNEILQIGAVRVEKLGGPIIDLFNVYIKPAIHKSFDLGAKRLPDLQKSLNSDFNFAAAMELFRVWCGGEGEYAVWGGDDLAILAQNCEYWNVPGIEMRLVYNFQTALAYLLDADQQIALWRAVDYLGIPDTYTFHNALNDAMYTAAIGCWLTPKSLAFHPSKSHQRKQVRRKTALRLSTLPFEKQPRHTVGPFQTVEALLDARASRRPACPICGQKGSVSQWRLTPKRADKPQQGFSVFYCPKHGRFLCRVVLSQTEDGLWRGRLTVPIIRPELIKEYLAAYRGIEYNCKSNAKRRWRPGKARLAKRP